MNHVFFIAGPVIHLPENFNFTIEMKAQTTEKRQVPFTAHPQPTVTLTYKGSEVKDADRTKVVLSENQAEFVVEKGERVDTGDYEMVLSNDFGITSLPVKLTVLGK